VSSGRQSVLRVADAALAGVAGTALGWSSARSRPDPRLRTLAELARMSTRLPNARAEVCAGARELLDADTVVCFERTGRELQGVEVAGAPLPRRPVVDVDDRDAVVARSFRDGRAVFRRGAETVLAVPIIRGVDRLGVLMWLWRRPKRRLTAAERYVVDIVVGEKGMAVERGHLLVERDERLHGSRLPHRARARPGPPAPRPLMELGLRQALSTLVDAARERHATQISFETDVVDVRETELRPSVLETVYGVVDKLLRSAVEARARHIAVRVELDAGELITVVEDDGTASDRPATTDGDFAMRAIRERTQLVGGTLEMSTGAGLGTRASLQIPRPRSSDILAGRSRARSGRADRLAERTSPLA
jgi:hypothetical protein